MHHGAWLLSDVKVQAPPFRAMAVILFVLSLFSFAFLALVALDSISNLEQSRRVWLTWSGISEMKDPHFTPVWKDRSILFRLLRVSHIDASKVNMKYIRIHICGY